MTDESREQQAQTDDDRQGARFGGIGLVAGVTIGAVFAVAAAAYAASMPLNQGSIGTSAADQPSCGNPGLNFNTVRTRYVAAGDRYEIASIDVDSVPTSCRGSQVVRITAADVATPQNAISNGNAAPNDGALLDVLSSNNNTETWTSGQGPLLNNVSNTNSNVTFTVVFRG